MTQQNSKCRLCGDRDETINHIISECTKLAQNEYETRHDWVGKVIPWEMCKKFKFDHTDKCYMHNPKAVLKDDTHKLLKKTRDMVESASINMELSLRHLDLDKQKETGKLERLLQNILGKIFRFMTKPV